MPVKQGFTRRSGVSYLGIGGVAAAIAPTFAALAKAADIDFTDIQTNLRLLAKLQGDTSGLVLYSYSVGKLFAIRAGHAVELPEYGKVIALTEGCRISITRLRPDGGYEQSQRAWMLYKDPVTDAYISELKNPFTEELVKIPPFRAGISGETMTPAGPVLSASFEMDSTVLGKPPVLEWKVIGDQVIASRQAFTRWKSRTSGKWKTEMTNDTWVCRKTDLTNDALSVIPSAHSWVSQTEFIDWLNMPAGIEGNCIWRSDAVRISNPSDLPRPFVEASERLDPKIITARLTFPS